MNLTSLKSRIRKALEAAKPPSGVAMVLYHCHADADELTREMARDAALDAAGYVGGPLLCLCLEHKDEGEL